MQPILRRQLSSKTLCSTSRTAALRPAHLPSTHLFQCATARTGGGQTSFSTTTHRSMPELKGDPNQHDHAKFAEGLSGSCLCGSINVTIRDKELFTKRRGHLCHCANCRKVAGSFVSSNLIIEEEKVTIEDRDGTLKEYKDHDTGSGTPLGRFFCSCCGNPVKSVVPALAGKVIIKMGMFPKIPHPEFETFGIHRHPWQGRHSDMKSYKIKAREDILYH